MTDLAIKPDGMNYREMSVRGMVTPDVDAGGPIRSQVSDAEWRARVDLAACYRLMALYGMTDMLYNHITARVPDDPERYLINAYGMHYAEITASSLHKVDHEGNIVLRGNVHHGVNHPGIVIHSNGSKTPSSASRTKWRSAPIVFRRARPGRIRRWCSLRRSCA
ncbi:hypothetical protein GCM10023144_18200 [Pigmentiphaga soli]|uniref:Class II aldolase/adducin N-terminal domain-containing protein n=1 Tax=Pigmentiphaga soli TaxID=1007095 RepID=A0ABP8GV95_9BURK